MTRISLSLLGMTIVDAEDIVEAILSSSACSQLVFRRSKDVNLLLDFKKIEIKY
ncbi:hypothetical protein AXF42_Ash017521 [Apostasia shenzhenica]|uniref:Uncharacterized protein n=1 Tax=Apostasia shenzhenica TaxID=1088818 RepID=A0A2I0A352_9ASPA|nr:hypothetical protein AXF42_Ash017521 [Apostasia shenzhenica]